MDANPFSQTDVKWFLGSTL